MKTPRESKQPAVPKPSGLSSRQWQSESTHAAPLALTDPPNYSASNIPPPKDLSLDVSPGILCCGEGETINASASASGPGAETAEVKLNYPGGVKFGIGSVSHAYVVQADDCGTVLSFSAFATERPNRAAKVPVVKIITRTEAEHPDDRERKTIGVAEQVELFARPWIGTCTWKATGDYRAFIPLLHNATLYAGDREATVQIEATIKTTKEETIVPKSISCSVTFSVIEPSFIEMINQPGKPERHSHGIPSAGFCARVFILPTTVCFKNIVIYEGVAYYYGEGYWAPLNGIKHKEGPVGTVSEGDNTHPSIWDAVDSVWKGGLATWPVSEGMVTVSIPWIYNATYNPDNPKVFAHVTSTGLTDDTGRTVVSKGGHIVSKDLNAPDEGAPGQCEH